MNAKIAVSVIRIEVIIYLLLCNLDDCTFNEICKFQPYLESFYSNELFLPSLLRPNEPVQK